jgi:hypothetical protein
MVDDVVGLLHDGLGHGDQASCVYPSNHFEAGLSGGHWRTHRASASYFLLSSSVYHTMQWFMIHQEQLTQIGQG